MHQKHKLNVHQKKVHKLDKYKIADESNMYLAENFGGDKYVT